MSSTLTAGPARGKARIRCMLLAAHEKSDFDFAIEVCSTCPFRRTRAQAWRCTRMKRPIRDHAPKRSARLETVHSNEAGFGLVTVHQPPVLSARSLVPLITQITRIRAPHHPGPAQWCPSSR